MFMGLGMPIPDLSNKPGPGRPGWSAGTYDFQFEVTGAVTIKAQPAATGQSFTIKWPNGTEQTTTGGNSIAAPDSTAGIVSINKKTDNTYADTFAIVGGQTNVSQVVSWGSNPWKTLANAFENCSNLISLSDTTLTTASTCNFQYAFHDCTSLEYVDLRKWDLSKGVNTFFWFEGCSNLGEIDMTGSSVSLYSRSDNMFANVGRSTTDGCLFKMSGVNWSNTANSEWYNMFNSSRIKKDSTFANWVFPSSMTTGISFFQCVFRMQDTTLDCSGWTTYSSTNLPNFSQLNYAYNGYAQPPSSSTGFKIDITNLNVSNVTSLQQSFYYSFQDEIVGLSTLGATNGATSMNIMFAYNRFMKFTATNNFSNTFISSLNLNGATAFDQVFRSTGSSVPDVDAGIAPNLSGLDLSNVNTFPNTFFSAKFANAPDFTNVTMNASTDYSFNSTFRGCKFLDGGNVNSLFSKTFGISNLNQTFRDARMGSIIFGSNIDLSTNNTLSLTFYNFGFDIASPTIEFADNVSFANVQNFDRPFFNVGTTNTPLSTCQVDNFIRRLHATRPLAGAITYKTIDFQNSAVTGAPSLVRGLADDLVSSGGYILNLYSTDVTLPFAYPSYSFDSEVTQSVTPTTIPTGGQFSSTDPGLTVDQNTGVVSWDSTYMGLPIIRCTYTDGCYNEVQMSMIVTVNNNFSMEFEGTSSYIDCGDSDDFSFGNSTTDTGFSISTWINMDDATRFRIANKYDNPGSKEYIFTTSGSDLLSLNLYDSSSGGYIGRKYNTALTSYQGQWIHVACTYDGTRVSSGIKLYLNGVKVDDVDNNSGSYEAMENTTVPFRIAQQSGTYANGKIDELSVFNRELTPAQVKLIYDANSTNKSIKLSNLPGGAPVAWYRMGD